MLKLRERLTVRKALLSAASLAVVAGLLSAGSADASGRPRAVPPPPAAPTSADQIQNVDQVKTAIKAYYGDTLVDGEHLASPTSAYAQEVAGIEADAQRYLQARLQHRQRGHDRPMAVIFDVDDTSLVTYNYEIFSNFVFNPATNADFVNGQRFKEVFGMPALANWAAAHGIEVIFLTGRPQTQRDATAGNLTKVGFTVPVDTPHLFLKYVAADPTTFPAYLPCAPTCTTTQYKSLTREHIESLGFDIIANFGDQFSDLNGGFADRTFKMPNPMYFLP